jgi:hypothetical protein
VDDEGTRIGVLGEQPGEGLFERWSGGEVQHAMRPQTACGQVNVHGSHIERGCTRGATARMTIAPSTALGKGSNRPARGRSAKAAGLLTARLSRVRAPASRLSAARENESTDGEATAEAGRDIGQPLTGSSPGYSGEIRRPINITATVASATSTNATLTPATTSRGREAAQAAVAVTNGRDRRGSALYAFAATTD